MSLFSRDGWARGRIIAVKKGGCFMRKIIGVAIVMWLSQPAQAQTPIYEFIDVGSAPGGGAQVYSAFLLDYRENKFYVCSASYKTGQPPTATCREDTAYSQQSVNLKRIKCAKRPPYGSHAECFAAWPLASRSAAGDCTILYHESYYLRERNAEVTNAVPVRAQLEFCGRRRQSGANKAMLAQLVPSRCPGR